MRSRAKILETFTRAALAASFLIACAPEIRAQAESPPEEETFREIYRNFYETYRLGPGDELAVRVLQEPDYSLERVRISPSGRIYHPLIGDLMVAGMTAPQLARRLTEDLAEYLKGPRVMVELLEAQSARFGVLGEVRNPGVFPLARPMRVLDAITLAGGVIETGNSSRVALLRASRDGRLQTLEVNVSRIMKGQADSEENLPLQAGDTIVVSGNRKKTLSYIISLAGFSSFLTLVGLWNR